ncbi:MAG: hypothetical protein JJU45_16515 [Acidimicrobiia bacterium]|nr:hypothetical protein [Acidimicrobiia bacterium]
MANEENDARDANQRMTRMLVECGERLGFTVVKEYAVSGGRIDVMWLWQPQQPIPGLETAVPIVGFEIESSWRTRKHIKGDMVNLLDAGSALGVIVCAGTTEKDDALRHFARALVDRPGPTILIWSADDVERLHAGEPDPLPVATTPGSMPVGSGSDRRSRDHGGKYQPLWSWLRSHHEQSVTVTFAELEEAIGMPLPPSCRRHAAHWHSYEGSAVARAIIDAGWRSSQLRLSEQTVTFVKE